MSYCKIFLDGDRTTYSPAQNVGGQLVCHINSSKNVRGVIVEIHGFEHTSWMENESYYNQLSKKLDTRSVTYTGDNTLWRQNIVLLGEGTLPPGDYSYPFIFRLPPVLPSSFENFEGYIKYYVRAKINIRFGFDYKDEKLLTMYSPLDLNKLDISTAPINLEDERNVCCWCCRNGIITMQVQLSVFAFAKHETLNVKVYVLNMSNINVERVSAKIKMGIESKVTFPRHKSKYATHELAVARESGIGAHGDCTYNLRLGIAENTVVPNFQGSELFSKNCNLQVKAVLPSCHLDLKVNNSIIIGDIPLRGQPTYYPPAVPANVGFILSDTTVPPIGPNAPVDDTIPTAPPSDIASSDYDNPPSYDEALKKHQRRHTTEKQ